MGPARLPCGLGSNPEVRPKGEVKRYRSYVLTLCRPRATNPHDLPLSLPTPA